MNRDDEDACDECELCGGDHETSRCEEVTICGCCFEVVDNCDCDECDEIDAAEWVKRGQPRPVVREAMDA